MEIFLSINNREKVIKLPYLPPEITIASPQGNDTYQTTTGELNIIGNKGLKTLSFSSFFNDWSLVNQIETMRDRKVPIRLVITGSPVNMPVTIDEFEATMRSGKKVWYSISFREFKFLGGVT